jgi:small multidrug resistance family-3 protein
MDKVVLLGFLIAATSLEATGDALVRLGINQNQWMVRSLLFVAGAILLFGYGLSVNLAPVDFGRVVGLYIAMLFITWQPVNWLVFQVLPVAPVVVGGFLLSLAEQLSRCGNDRDALSQQILWIAARARCLLGCRHARSCPMVQSVRMRCRQVKAHNSMHRPQSGLMDNHAGRTEA